jgi:hypothetical protein
MCTVLRAVDYSPVSDRGVMGLIAGHTICDLCVTWGHRERISPEYFSVPLSTSFHGQPIV